MDKFVKILPVNYTDLLTDDVFKSTVHRAINRSGVRRYSIPLFFGTDYDVTIEVESDLPLRMVTDGLYVGLTFLRVSRTPSQVQTSESRGLREIPT
jgi:isopenicillin N synthase-like dioxygenase